MSNNGSFHHHSYLQPRIVSFLAFSNQRLVSDLIFIPLLLPSKNNGTVFSCGLIPQTLRTLLSI